MRLKFVNLNAKEIRAQLRRVWTDVLSPDERAEFAVLAQQQACLGTKVQVPAISERLEAALFGRTETVRKINELKGRIQEIKFPFSHSEADANDGKDAAHTLLKPSGKLKFKSAQRFFRMEMVPILKKIEPTLDS